MPDIEKWKQDYMSKKTEECPFCGGENLEHTCRNCYSDIDEDVCWKYEGYCQKCFLHIFEEIPEIDKLKLELGVKCQCNEPECRKCLLVSCQDDGCPVHKMTDKVKSKALLSTTLWDRILLKIQKLLTYITKPSQ